ncbi:sugar transferase [Nocardioides sp. CCNWLW239]|uniref:sugar transferase n=1 Tax=Nocardioides sp. CCNWLW239 TaxID=3128902 RepID=UPI003019A837
MTTPTLTRSDLIPRLRVYDSEVPQETAPATLPPPTGPSTVVKNVADRLAALVLLVVALPVLVGIGLLVFLTDRGPVFYVQERVGRLGRRFPMVKFRSMRVGAHAEVVHLVEENDGAGPLFKMRRDPRVTAVGRVLRRYSLDELPQLFNVLAGQMSLVGPRPALPAEVDAYDERERGRLAVRPGITGLWQVSGRSDLDWETSISLDLQYVRCWSLLGDLSILGRTFGAVFGGRGAY